MSASRSETLRIDGRAFRSGRSRSEPATLVLDAAEARLLASDGSVLCTLSRSELHFDAPIGQAARRATLPDGTLFETGDSDGVAALAPGSAEAILHGLERFHPRLLLFALACLLGIWALWRYGLDLVVGLAIALTPAPLIGAIDRGVLASIDLVHARPSEIPGSEQAATAALFERLLSALPPGTREAHDFALTFRRMEGLGPNAFALPGGTVVMTDAFLDQVTDQDARAGVLAHEIGHVTGRHGLRQLYRSAGIAALAPLIAGDTGPVIEDMLLEANLLLSLTYSRASEHDADRSGIHLAREAGYDPAGLVTFLEMVAQEEPGLPGWASTHPATVERIANLREQIGD